MTSANDTWVASHPCPASRLGGGFCAVIRPPRPPQPPPTAACSPRLLVRGEPKQGIVQGDLFSGRNGGALRSDYVHKDQDRLLPLCSARSRITEHASPRQELPRLPPPAPLHAASGVVEAIDATMRAPQHRTRPDVHATMRAARCMAPRVCLPRGDPTRVSPPNIGAAPRTQPRPSDDEADALLNAVAASKQASKAVQNLLSQRFDTFCRPEEGTGATAVGVGGSAQPSPRRKRRAERHGLAAVVVHASPPTEVDGSCLPSIYNGMVRTDRRGQFA